MITVTRAQLKSAMRRYDAGDRQFPFTKPRSWYLIGAKGKVYPLKYVFALALGKKPGDFQTSDAVREVRKQGFEIWRETKEASDDFNEKVAASLRAPKTRAARLEKAPKLPRRVRREILVFERNPDVVAETLVRANGRCGVCKKPAPFARKSNQSPYLEVHHKLQLAQGGEDTVENAIALCPNCHRREHHG